jgi:hypothetical protein
MASAANLIWKKPLALYSINISIDSIMVCESLTFYQLHVLRRRRLQDQAEAHLLRGVTDQLCIRPDTLLNVNAYEAYTLLAATSAKLEGLLERYQWSVFDYVCVNLDLADRLRDAGFRDVNEVDKNKATCLTKLWEITTPCDLEVFLQKAHWLISKGAEIHHQNSSESALHSLGNNEGTILFWTNREDDFF